MRRNLSVVASARSRARGWTAVAVSAVAALLALGVFESPASAASGTLSYGGGPVVHSSTSYLVFWVPSGESIAPSSQALMARFFADVAADSGKSSTVFGVLGQYYDRHGFADYRETFNSARQVIVAQSPGSPFGSCGAAQERGSLHDHAHAERAILNGREPCLGERR